jgi:hypothetical protein
MYFSTVLFLLVIAVHVVSWWPRWFAYEPLAKRFRRNHPGFTQATAEKFSQAITAAKFHILMGLFAWNVLREKEWLWQTEKWSEDGQRNTSVEPDFKFYYLLYAARYTSDLISLGYEHSRSVSVPKGVINRGVEVKHRYSLQLISVSQLQDTLAYAIHHVISIGLVLLSAHAGCTRIGGVVMFFFDWADPPMMIGKAFLYLSLEAEDAYQTIADICMGVFVAVFIVTRNIIFTRIVYICFRDLPNTSHEVIALKAMLLVLVGLMTFWFGLIAKTIYYQLFSNQGHVDDIREDNGIKKSKKNI